MFWEFVTDREYISFGTDTSRFYGPHQLFSGRRERADTTSHSPGCGQEVTMVRRHQGKQIAPYHQDTPARRLAMAQMVWGVLILLIAPLVLIVLDKNIALGLTFVGVLTAFLMMPLTPFLLAMAVLLCIRQVGTYLAMEL
jgi:hypothetical protein